VIRHHFNWKRLGGIGVIACNPDGSGSRLLIHLEPGSINKEIIVEFLVKLHREIDGPVDLLWDGLPAYKSAVVREHVSQNKEWLEIHRFPAYAPELNPVEYLWSSVKDKDVANFCSDTLHQVEHKVRQAIHRIDAEQQIIRGFILASISAVYAQETVNISVPGSITYNVFDTGSSTRGFPNPTTISFTDARLLASNALRISMRADTASFTGPNGVAIPASCISWSTSSAQGGTGSNGTLSSTSYTQVFQSNLNPASGSVDITWTLSTPPGGIRSGVYSIAVHWELRSVAP